jgi:hypothetical protein
LSDILFPIGEVVKLKRRKRRKGMVLRKFKRVASWPSKIFRTEEEIRIYYWLIG